MTPYRPPALRGLLAALLLTFAIPPMPQAKAQSRDASPDKPVERTVTVTGRAAVEAEPDIAHVSSGVATEGGTAREALAANSAAMRKVIDGLKAAGIAPRDIQTSGLHVEPRYTQPKPGQAAVVNGYRAVNQVHVTVRDLARVGELLDQVASLGANQIGGLSFDVSKADELKDEARRKAVATALRKARLYAEASGASVGEVIAISEDAGHVQPRGGVLARSAMAEAVPIERGSQTLEATVRVTWALK